MLLILAALALIGGAVAVAVDLASEHVPQYAEKLRTQWQQFASWAGGHGLPVKGGVSADGAMRDRLVGWLTGGLRSAWAVLTLLVLVLFFVALMLLEAPRWCEKVEASMRGSRAHATLDTTASVASQVRQYLLVRTMLGAVTAVLNGLWLWAMGVDLALVWAMLFFVLNYIPTIGSIVAAVPPALVALAGLGPGRALVVIAGLLVIEQFMGNFVDPRWVGRRLSLSPLVVLVAVVFWGWVWGVAGALLAVPMTATIVVACAHVPSLRPLALLLSRTGSMEQMARRTHSDGDAA